MVTHIKYITLAEEQAVQKQYQNLRTKIQNNARQRGKKTRHYITICTKTGTHVLVPPHPPNPGSNIWRQSQVLLTFWEAKKLDHTKAVLLLKLKKWQGREKHSTKLVW